MRTYRLADAPSWRLKARRQYRKLYETVMRHYGGGELRCACCKETEIGFLTLDHINNDGASHRKALFGKPTSGPGFYLWLKRSGFPDGFQILCYNCNCSKGKYGKCAHKLTDAERIALSLGTYKQMDFGLRLRGSPEKFAHTAPPGGMAIPR